MEHSGERSEEELVRCARTGDREAFDVLVRQCAEKIFNAAYRLTGNEQEAEDIAQNAFIKAFKNIHRFKHTCKFSSWMYRIAVNIWKNKVRYEKRRGFFKIFSFDKAIDGDESTIPREVADPHPEPSNELEQQELRDDVRNILNELDEETREIIVLRDIEGMEYEEIGEVLGLKLGTVKSRLARARDILRSHFIQYNEVK